MSEVIDLFPRCSPVVPEPTAVDDTEKLHAQAFRDLEGAICDCLRMAEIVVLVMPDDTEGHLMFAAHQMQEMLERFKKDYYARWHGEQTGPS